MVRHVSMDRPAYAYAQPVESVVSKSLSDAAQSVVPLHPSALLEPGLSERKLEVVVDEVEFFVQRKQQNPPVQNITEQDVDNGLYAEDIPFD